MQQCLSVKFFSLWLVEGSTNLMITVTSEWNKHISGIWFTWTQIALIKKSSCSLFLFCLVKEWREIPECFQHLESRCRQPRVPSHQPLGQYQNTLPSCRGTCCCIRPHSGCAGATRCESGNDTEPGRMDKSIFHCDHWFSTCYFCCVSN